MDELIGTFKMKYRGACSLILYDDDVLVGGIVEG